MKKVTRGLLIGRMQPVHNGHIQIIEKTLRSCNWNWERSIKP